MDTSVLPKDEIWFLRVCRDTSTGLFHTVTANIPVSTGTRREDAGLDSSTVHRRCGWGICLEDNIKMHTVD